MTENKLNNYYREQFLRTVSEICFLNGEYMDAIEYAIQKMDDEIPYDFNPLKYFVFEPIYTFEINGTTEPLLNNGFCSELLYERNGHLLSVTEFSIVGALSNITEAYELWLLDNMKLTVVHRCNMMVSSGITSETASYRSRVKGGIDKFKLHFDVEIFAKEIIEDTLLSMYGEDYDEIDDDEECMGDCSICPNCALDKEFND